MKTKRVFLDETARAKARAAVMGKPTIDEVLLAFNLYRAEISRAVRLHKPRSVELVMAFDDAKAKLRKRLLPSGIADLINWEQGT